MKTTNLDLIEVQKLSGLEMKNCNGGLYWLVPFLAGVIASGIVGEVIRDGVKQCIDDFKAGFNSVEDK